MNFKSEKPQATILRVTPDIAIEMLKTSTGNRRIRGWYVQQLAVAMKQGEWRITSQGIGFTKSGVLKDAHHRLNACVLAKCSFDTVCVYGLEEDAYEVIDTGIRRTISDLMNIPKRIAQPLRLAASLFHGGNPTVAQIKPYAETGLVQCLDSLIQYCGTDSRFYSSAPMKLAAAIHIMSGAPADFVMRQYRALCLADYDSLTPSGKALRRQVETGKAESTSPRDALARGIVVFDPDRASVTKIQVSEPQIDAATAFVKRILLERLVD